MENKATGKKSQFRTEPGKIQQVCFFKCTHPDPRYKHNLAQTENVDVFCSFFVFFCVFFMVPDPLWQVCFLRFLSDVVFWSAFFFLMQCFGIANLFRTQPWPWACGARSALGAGSNSTTMCDLGYALSLVFFKCIFRICQCLLNSGLFSMFSTFFW